MAQENLTIAADTRTIPFHGIDSRLLSDLTAELSACSTSSVQLVVLCPVTGYFACD